MKKITSFLFIMIFYASSLQGVSLEKTIKMTLSNNPNILIQKEQVNYFKGQYLLSTYPFDLKLSLSSSAQKDKAITSFFSTQNKSTINHNLSVNKYLESGYFLESGLDFSYQRTSYNSNLLSKQNQNSIYFTLKKPLLKNTSKDIVTSGKTLAQYDLDISYLNYDNQINDSVYNSIVMYWNLVYANEKYKLDVKLQKRAKDLLTNIKYLIKSDIKPKSDLLQPEANLNSKAISTLASKQNLISLKNDLGLHLGVELDTYYDEKKLQSFPKPDTEDISTLDTQTSYFHTCGMTNRNDLKTQYVKIKKSQLELKMAKDSLKSDLDLTFRVSITGANEDGDLITSVGNLYNNDIRGNSIYLGLQYEVPVNNSLARGNYLSSLSSLKMKKIDFLCCY